MIVALSGLISCGKDTVSNYLVKQHGYTKLSWASSVKDAVASIFGWDRDLLEGDTAESRQWRERVDCWWAERLDIPNFSPRYALQRIATDLFRDRFHSDIWIASLEYKLYKLSKDTSHIVISDTRFVNELDAVRKLGGITVRVVRSPEPEWVNDYMQHGLTSEWEFKYPAVHVSEYSSIGYNYDYVVNNDSTVDSLYQQINDLLECHRFSR
jgi:hypothetical protein